MPLGDDARRAHLLRRQRRLVALQLTRELWLAMAPFLPRFGLHEAAA